MSIVFGRCSICNYLVELPSSNKLFNCPYCNNKMSKEEAISKLEEQLNNKIIMDKINDNLKLANKYLESKNYEHASRIYHEVISINPYNIDSYIGLIISITEDFTKKPLIIKGTLDTINIKEIKQIVDILNKLDESNKYSSFISASNTYINNYQEKVKNIEDSTLYIQLKVINEENKKTKKANKKNIKKILHILTIIISIIIFILEPLYGFIFLIISSILVGLIKEGE